MNRQPLFGLLPMRVVPVTATLSGIIVFLSLGGRLAEVSGLGVGWSLLSLDRDALWDLQLWRLVTYAFFEASFFSLIFSVLILWIFGGWFETRYGRRDYFRFFMLSTVGAAILSLPLGWLFSFLPFADTPGMGPGAALDAMLVAFALADPSATVLFGFVLPMRASTIIYLLLALEVVRGIMDGAAALSITLAGMLMGYLLVTGYWRPRRLLARLGVNARPRRLGLYVVPPDSKTLH